MELYDTIDRPTLLIDREKVVANIQAMAAKAARNQVRFRPHFKTHQSAVVGEWYRPEGVNAITVSSVEMAEYFAQAGWKDITIAFSLNWREIQRLRGLASEAHLGLLVESVDTAEFLRREFQAPADIWLKVDEGSGRTGILWNKPEEFLPLLDAIQSQKNLTLRGLLSHAGRTYRSDSPEKVAEEYQEGVQRMNDVRNYLKREAGVSLEITTGDTPGCSICEDLGNVDEIRPGNYVFYDAQQYRFGSCQFDQIAAAVACPVIAKHPERNEVVIYGGAVHLSKDLVKTDHLGMVFGLVAYPAEQGWSKPIQDGGVVRVSQEHGIIALPPADFARVRVGDLLMVIPAHVCLTVSALRRYRTLDGEWIDTFNV